MGFWISLIASVVASWLTASAIKSSLREQGGTKVNKNSNVAQIPIVYGERKVTPLAFLCLIVAVIILICTLF